jgi:hypothetical protein
MASVPPPVSNTCTLATVGPVAAVTTAMGLPSATPIIRASTAASGWDRVAGATPDRETPTISGVDTSTCSSGKPSSQPLVNGTGGLRLVRNTLRVIPSVVRVNNRVSFSLDAGARLGPAAAGAPIPALLDAAEPVDAPVDAAVDEVAPWPEAVDVSAAGAG